MKIAYYYLFFKLYILNNDDNKAFLGRCEAAMTILSIEILVILCILADISMIIEADILTLPNVHGVFLGMIFILALLKYYVFFRKDKWRTYHSLFQSWSKEKRNNADVIIRVIIYFLVTNYVLLFYILANTTWLV